jgi:hypothetical protein
MVVPPDLFEKPYPRGSPICKFWGNVKSTDEGSHPPRASTQIWLAVGQQTRGMRRARISFSWDNRLENQANPTTHATTLDGTEDPASTASTLSPIPDDPKVDQTGLKDMRIRLIHQTALPDLLSSNPDWVDWWIDWLYNQSINQSIQRLQDNQSIKLLRAGLIDWLVMDWMFV